MEEEKEEKGSLKRYLARGRFMRGETKSLRGTGPEIELPYYAPMEDEFLFFKLCSPARDEAGALLDVD